MHKKALLFGMILTAVCFIIYLIYLITPETEKNEEKIGVVVRHIASSRVCGEGGW